MGVTITGDGLVKVWDSNPTFGDPFEGVFYMEPPYSYEQFERHARDRAKRWIERMAGRGYGQHSRFKVQGPFQFLDVGRRDLTPEREGDDEWVLVAWFKRDRPEILPLGEIEDRRLMAQRYGITPPEPLRRSDPTPGVRALEASELGAYRDPHGLNEAGLPVLPDEETA
jgi:hypothetical protein